MKTLTVVALGVEDHRGERCSVTYLYVICLLEGSNKVAECECLGDTAKCCCLRSVPLAGHARHYREEMETIGPP